MKKLLFLLSVLFLMSCSITPTKVELAEQKKLTTIELVELAQKDTMCYHVVKKGNDFLYVLDENYIVVEKCVNYSDIIGVLLVLIGLFLLAGLIVGSISRS